MYRIAMEKLLKWKESKRRPLPITVWGSRWRWWLVRCWEPCWGRGDGIEKRSLFGGDGNIEGRYRVFHGENHENLSVRHFLLDGP